MKQTVTHFSVSAVDDEPMDVYQSSMVVNETSLGPTHSSVSNNRVLDFDLNEPLQGCLLKL